MKNKTTTRKKVKDDVRIKKTTLDDIINLIRKWEEDNDYYVCYYGNFISFDQNKMKRDEKNIIKDSGMVCFGPKDDLRIMRQAFQKKYKKEKDDYVIW
jgi:hypothetical protein